MLLLAIFLNVVVVDLAGGSGWGPALRAAVLTREDWEIVPEFLVVVGFCGALLGVGAAVVWWTAMKRLRRRRTARLLAACAAAAPPLLVLAVPNWLLAVAGAATAGLLAAIVVPRLGSPLPPTEPTSYR